MNDKGIQRVRYFNGQVLFSDDFQDEQAYHMERQARHNQRLHTSGIVVGLAVAATDAGDQIRVEPGEAIDAEGRWVVLDQRRDLPVPAGNGSFLVEISFQETPSESAATRDGGQAANRWREVPALHFVPEGEAAGAPPSRLSLARLRVEGGRVAELQSDVRLLAGCRLADGAVTRAKLAPDLLTELQSPASQASAPSAESRLEPAEATESKGSTAATAMETAEPAELADGSVTNGKLADAAVNADKLAAAAVTGAKLATGAVTRGKLAAGAVGVNKLAQDVLDLGVPSRGILMWSGEVDNVPSGWALCDGSQETPDLSSSFVEGEPGVCYIMRMA